MTISTTTIDGVLYMTTDDLGNGTAIRTFYRPDGTVLATEEIDVDPPATNDAPSVLVATQEAREAISGFSRSSGTRQAIEKLADALETVDATLTALA